MLHLQYIIKNTIISSVFTTVKKPNSKNRKHKNIYRVYQYQQQEIETFDRSSDRPLEKLLVPFLTVVKKEKSINDTEEQQNEEINRESVKLTRDNLIVVLHEPVPLGSRRPVCVGEPR